MLQPLLQLEHFTAPWQSLYNNSKALSTTVTAVHLLAMFIGGGFAVAADRSTLRALRADGSDRAHQLAELHDIHRPVLIALSALFVSGVLQSAADVKTFATSPVFWVKMALVALLLVNGAVLTATETSLRRAGAQRDVAQPRLWTRLRTSSWCSLFLWTTTLLAGVVLQNAS